MYSKDYFVTKPEDLAQFKQELSNYKDWYEKYIKNNHSISITQFVKDSAEAYSKLEALLNKYSYLSSVKNTEEVAKVFEEMITEYQKFSNPLGQSQENYDFMNALTTSNDIQARLKERYLKSFKDNGLNLDKDSQLKLNNLKEDLSKAGLKYSENLLKSKKEWVFIADEELKSELDDQDLKIFEEENGKLVLKYNQNAMSDALVKTKSSKLRKIIYEAFKYPGSPKSNFDNTKLTAEILNLKQSIAKTLGYKNYTELALKDRMAGSYENVSNFLNKVKTNVVPLARKEYQELNNFIKNEYGLDQIEKSDRAYYYNLKKEKDLNYEYNMERPYFPKNKVFDGVYSLINKLFGFSFVKDNDAFELPYEDSECYRVYEGEVLKAYLIVDMYERPLKSAGAWVSGMSEITNEKVGLIAMCCNINKKDEGLDISEINTLLHELGHAVHHFSSQVEFGDMAGTSGMARDAVEIPSQMLEQYAYNRDFIESISEHIETKDKLPSEMLDSIIKSKNYGIGGHYARQLAFALFDINIYHDFNGDITEFYKSVANEILPAGVDEDTNFPNTFTHIFDGGYSAGYYGYMWADIYSIDAYSFVIENEAVNSKIFKNEFLSKGSSQDAKEIYEKFRGKSVDENSFFKYYGIS